MLLNILIHQTDAPMSFSNSRHKALETQLGPIQFKGTVIKKERLGATKSLLNSFSNRSLADFPRSPNEDAMPDLERYDKWHNQKKGQTQGLLTLFKSSHCILYSPLALIIYPYTPDKSQIERATKI